MRNVAKDFSNDDILVRLQHPTTPPATSWPSPLCEGGFCIRRNSSEKNVEKGFFFRSAVL